MDEDDQDKADALVTIRTGGRIIAYTLIAAGALSIVAVILYIIRKKLMK